MIISDGLSSGEANKVSKIFTQIGTQIWEYRIVPITNPRPVRDQQRSNKSGWHEKHSVSATSSLCLEKNK